MEIERDSHHIPNKPLEPTPVTLRSKKMTPADTNRTAAETKPTPGPWEAYPWSHPMRKARHLILGAREDGASPVVAEVYEVADARLIASAHALRDACSTALDWISELPSDAESRRFTLQTLRAAIAKADAR